MGKIYNSKYNQKDIIILILHLFLVGFVLALNYKFNSVSNNLNSSHYGFKKVYDPIILKNFMIFFDSNFSSIINNFIFPLVSFLVFVIIFYKFLPMLWSISISLLSILQSNELHLRDFIFLNIDTKINYADLAITHFPYPSLSILIFLIFILISFNINFDQSTSIKKNFIKVLTALIMWSILIHIQPLDGLLGFIFTFLYLNIKLYKKYNKKFYNFFYFFFIAIITSINFLVIYFNLNLSVIEQSHTNQRVDFYFIFFYLIFPMLLLALIYHIQKIDFAEILIKFSNIFILIITEIILILVLKIYGFSFINHLGINRSTVFFLHFYYYVPFVYYLVRPIALVEDEKFNFYLMIKQNINLYSFIFLNFFIFLIYFNSLFVIFI